MDHKRVVQPGEDIQIQAAGDFLFLKSATGPVVVSINGDPVTMVAGGKRRPAGGFEGFEVSNPDASNPVVVVFVVGRGDYNEQIVRGEITINPGIRGADGVFVDDTRSTLALTVAIGNITPQSYTAGEKMGTLINEGSVFSALVSLDQNRTLYGNDNGAWYLYDKQSGATQLGSTLGGGSGCVVGNEVWIGDAINVTSPIFAIRRYDLATLQWLGDIPTDIGWQAPYGKGPYAVINDPDNQRLYLAITRNANNIADSVEGLHAVDYSGKTVAKYQPTGSLGTLRSLALRNGVITGYQNDGAHPIGVWKAGTLAQLTLADSTMPAFDENINALVLTDRDTALMNNYGHDLVEYSVEDITISASGTVSSCAGAGRLKGTTIQTKANVKAERRDNGNIVLSGEVLRAVLEIYAGRYMPDNYLDYIYAVKAENLNGISPRRITTGGESFLAAGVKDDAWAVFPQTIEITIREGLL